MKGGVVFPNVTMSWGVHWGDA